MERMTTKMKEARAQRREVLEARRARGDAGRRVGGRSHGGSRRSEHRKRHMTRLSRRGSLELTPLIERLATHGGTIRIEIELPARQRRPGSRSWRRHSRRWPVLA